ncbi:MAG: Ig-like domain-containing protein [Planctomycetota bacterium]
MSTQPRGAKPSASPASVTASKLAGCLLGLSAGVFGLAGCSGSSTPSPITNPTTTDFIVDGVNVVNGSVWKLNRPIDVRFTGSVDFSSINSNTIQITDTTGVPALGTYSLINGNTVRFQPLCPTNDEFSNGGFQKNRVYLLVVVGSDTSGVTVRDTAGNPVLTGITVSFQTPDSNDPVELFVDQVAGPPAVLIRGLGGVPLNSTNVTYVEFGGDPSTRQYLRLNTATQQGEITSDVPLNLYSRTEEQFEVVLQFNQPVNASPNNVSANRIRYEYRLPSGSWQPLQTEIELLDNCTSIGSSVRVTPKGILPQGVPLRINVRDGFEDLTGDAVQSDLVNFVRLNSVEVDDFSVMPPALLEGADEIVESFTFGGGGINSREDLLADSTKPRATWGNGVVEPSFNFAGTGGPSGTFDWVIRSGQTIFVDTAADQISGGPGGIGTQQTVINGVVDVRNMTVEEGGTLVFVGPNTVTILATGAVDIRGIVSLNGGNNPGVKTLNTTNQPEPGATGNAGGGTGGTGSYLTSQSTPRGGPGYGAFQRASFGGGGGESSYAPGNVDRRRGGGGGGGRFGQDTRYIEPGGAFVRCQSLIGFDAEPGFPGGAGGTGAVSQTQRAVGGTLGPFPFFDQFDDNDFLGVMRTAPVLGGGGSVLEPSRIIIGELTKVWAGSGGGAGGDAINANQFPVTPFNIGGDEKASGGGGGAGGIQILAIGEIRISPTGTLSADGGYGGAGENTYLFDRVGGGGGGGSGGHIVLSSAAQIVCEAEVAEGAGFNQALPFYTDPPAQLRHPFRPLSAMGGQGGAGKDDRCGANASGRRDWKVDAIPESAFEGLTTVPPLGNTPANNSFTACNTGSPTDPVGTTPGAGGDGGPGIIQLHATNLNAQILFPNAPGLYGNGNDITFSVAPPPLGWSRPTVAPNQMIPFFGDESEALSKWIALGEARRNSDGSTNQVLFQFDGTDQVAATLPERGIVERNGTTVQELAPAIAYASIVTGQTTVPFLTGNNVITLDASGLDTIYEKNDALMRNFTVRIRDSVTPTEFFDYRVLDAVYDEVNDRVALTVELGNVTLPEGVLQYGANSEVGLIPNYFQVLAAGVVGSYPSNTSVRITFDATNIDPITGLPDEDARYSVTVNAGELTPDITDLNATNWDFIRFRVEFDLNQDGLQGINLAAPRPALDFLRIPFRF